MEILLKASDIIQFAIRVEENGEAFYRKAALLAGDDDMRTFFQNLAGDEIGHKHTFQDMLSKVETHRPPESFPGEYIAYLHDYIDNKAIFTEDAANLKLAGVHDIISALDFAVQRELDSILYYQETRRFLPEKHHAVIDNIIEEERKHFANLAQKKKDIKK